MHTNNIIEVKFLQNHAFAVHVWETAGQIQSAAFPRPVRVLNFCWLKKIDQNQSIFFSTRWIPVEKIIAPALIV